MERTMATSSVTASSVTGWRAFLLGVALLASYSVFAGELLPYSPPTVVAGTTNSVPEEVYQRFRNDVRSLSAAQRQQLDAALPRVLRATGRANSTISACSTS
jgi:hypothetical protein